MPLCKRWYKGLVKVGKEWILRRGRCGASEAEVNDLVEEAVAVVLTGTQRISLVPGLSNVWESIV